MSLGEKIGKGFLKLAKKGDEIDEGLNDLLGENRTKAGDGFSKERTAKRTANFSSNKDKLILGKNQGEKDDEQRLF